MRHAVQVVEGQKVTPTKRNGLTATNSQPAEKKNLNNDLNFATGCRRRKDESTLIAILALAGYEVHKGDFEDYAVRKYGCSYHCQDLAELRAIAAWLGVCHE